MSSYTPDKWVVIKINLPEDKIYKVFACWYGGFLDSNSWKMNSGIIKATWDNDYWLFEGYSGSVYKCHKDTYGTHMYGQGVLQNYIDMAKKEDIIIEVMDENTNWNFLKYE